FCSAQGDLDSDGGVDLLVQDHLQPVKLYMNRTPAAFSGNWLHLRAKGRGANTHGIGTRVVASTGGRLQWREVAAGTGYKSQSSYRLHIGCGTDTAVAQIVVTFPKAGPLKRATRVLTGLPVNREWPLWPPEALGDANGDGVRSDADRIDLVKCLGQAFVPAIARMDIDGDSDVDATDLEAFDLVQCDLDGDGLVDAADLAMLLAAWGTPGVDFNDDGTTDDADAHRLLERWTGG
ncbi:MAG: ASPIC/UnbV domain-containing protein, partial [Planctomycetota bacterium]